MRSGEGRRGLRGRPRTARTGFGLVVAAAVGLCIVLLDRWLVLTSAGHLMFDVNQAEYGYLAAVIPWIPVHMWEVLTNPGVRASFFRDCVMVGNQVHGTLGVAGLATLWGAQLSDGPLSTGLIRGLALLQSSLALLLWCWGLGRATRSWRVVLGFCLLWAVAPTVPLKISLLWWGTHDTVTLVASGWMALLLPWLARPGEGLGVVMRASILGAAGGLVTLANHSLLMPVAGGLLFFGFVLAMRAMERRDGRQLLWCLAAVATALAGHQLVMRGVLSTGFLEGLGYPRGISDEHFLGLSGKRGRSFLHEAGSGWRELSAWQSEVWPIAVRQSPGQSYGPSAATAEAVARLGAVALGLGLVARHIWRAARSVSGGGAAAFVGLYLPLAALATGLLALRFSPDLGGRAQPHPRYFAHIYPFAMAAVALAAGLPGRLQRLRPLLLVWPLWLGAWDHAQLIDLTVVKDRIGTAPYEAAPLYFRARPGRLPPDGWAA
ncbi:MAG: hypothetical protein VX000_00080, partial [Myxococcota bacterium]|nr:hypothetical protein [Myxococcota bacterium]